MLWLVADVELRHLRTMAAIAEEGTFGRAAARLGYTQSSVSQQIAALERALGGAVFDRPGGPRPVRITPLGEVVLAHGRDLLTKAEALADAVDRFRAGNGRIDIGTFQSVSNLILPAVVRRLLDEHPGCDIRLSEVEPEDPQIGDLDLLFHDGRIEGDVEHVKLLDEPYLLVAGAGAFPDGPVRVKLLDDAPMVAWPPHLSPNDGWSGRSPAPAHSHGSCFEPPATKPSCRWCGRASARRCCHGSPSTDPMPGPTTGSASTSCKPSPAREMYLHWPAGRTQSPLATRAIDIAVEAARDLTREESARWDPQT